MANQPRYSQALPELFGECHMVPSTVYLKTTSGSASFLLPYDSAAALLKQVTASPISQVTGDSTNGFAWPVPSSHPRRSYMVVPSAAPVWPYTPHPTAVTVELRWAPDQNGRRRVRTFVMWADSPYDAYLIACCLWSTKATGAGAEAAFLFGPDQRVAYRINRAAWTCSNIPAETIARALATTADRFSTGSLPLDRNPGNRRTSRREQLEVAASCTP